MERAARMLHGLTAGREVDRVVAVAPVGGTPTGGHESALAEEAQVVRDQALRLVDQGHQLLDRAVALNQFLQQPPAQRMGGETHEHGWFGTHCLDWSDRSHMADRSAPSRS